MARAGAAPLCLPSSGRTACGTRNAPAPCCVGAGSCAKQSYRAIVVSSSKANIPCDTGLVLTDHTGGYKCVAEPEKHPCSPGFSSEDELHGSVYARCKQVRIICCSALVSPGVEAVL